MPIDNERTLLSGRFLLAGRPYLVLGAELQNSSSSTPFAIRTALRAVADVGANTVLAPIAWESIEPREGEFDFRIVDELLSCARENRLKLIPLWFGTWKNGMSTYVPPWVKRDALRFPRIETEAGPIQSISPFSDSARDCDARAFGALMEHLRAVDNDHTVLMVQVENEVGVLGDTRDRCALAEANWERPVPSSVIESVMAGPLGRLRRAAEHGTGDDWVSLFGVDADEAFMATAFARYLEDVAAAGRARFDIPLYANAWLDSSDVSDGGDSELALAGGTTAGVYPSGGPLRHTAVIWRSLAPTLDFLAPDLYFGSFDTIAREYREISGFLFIPEMRCDRRGIEQMFRAVGGEAAAGVAPFGVDSLTPDEPDYEHIRDAYHLLRAVAAVVADNPDVEMQAFTLDRDSTELWFGTEGVEISSNFLEEIFPPDGPGFGCVARTPDGTFFAIGRGFAIAPLSKRGRPAFLRVEELNRDQSDWSVRRVMNGDEAGERVRLTALMQQQSPAFPIRQNTKTTGIIRFTIYDYSSADPSDHA